MTDPTRPLDDSSDDSLLDRLASEFFVAKESGESPDLEDYLRQLATDSDRDLFRRLVATGDNEIHQFIHKVEPGLVLADRYRLERKIGEGGMGEVWAAHDAHLERTVAVKILNSNACASLDSVENIRRETQLMQRIDHPGIAAVHDFCADGNMTFFAMQLVDGIPLSDVIGKASELGAKPTARDILRIIDREPTHEEDQILGNEDWYRSVARITAAILRILEAAHQKGVVHRDLKPNNIMLCGGGKPMLLDFGLGRTLDTKSGDITQGLFGTLFYVAPEQVETQQSGINPRSDVYQMGAVLYEFLTLKRAIKGDSISEVLTHISRGDVEMPRKLDEHVPRELQDICLKAMEHNVERRYASARAFREDLERYLGGTEIPTACRGSMARRARYFVRRNRTASLVAATIAITMTATWLLMPSPSVKLVAGFAHAGQAGMARPAAGGVELEAKSTTAVFAIAKLKSTSGEESFIPVRAKNPADESPFKSVVESGRHVVEFASREAIVAPGCKGELMFYTVTEAASIDILQEVVDGLNTYAGNRGVQTVPTDHAQDLLERLDGPLRGTGGSARSVFDIFDSERIEENHFAKLTVSL